MQRLTVLTTICVLVAGAAGCASIPQQLSATSGASPSTDASATATRVDIGDGTIVLVDSVERESTSDALVQGKIVSIQGQCLGIESGAGTDVLLLEYGTRATGGTIIAPDGEEFSIGDTVKGAGGFADLTESSFGKDLKASLPACFATGYLAYMNDMEHVA